MKNELDRIEKEAWDYANIIYKRDLRTVIIAIFIVTLICIKCI